MSQESGKAWTALRIAVERIAYQKPKMMGRKTAIGNAGTLALREDSKKPRTANRENPPYQAATTNATKLHVRMRMVWGRSARFSPSQSSHKIAAALGMMVKKE